MRVKNEKVAVEETTLPETQGAAPVAQVAAQGGVVVADIPDRDAHEKVVGRGASTVERRRNTPPILVRLNRHKETAHKEAKQRTSEIAEKREDTAEALEREEAKRKQFADFATETFVTGIVGGWEGQQRTLRLGGEEQIENHYDEHQYFDDRVRYEHEVLGEQEATQRRVEERDHTEASVERKTSDERRAEQRKLEQRIHEERTMSVRESIESRVEDRTRGRDRGSDRDGNDWREEDRYHEHNNLLRNR